MKLYIFSVTFMNVLNTFFLVLSLLFLMSVSALCPVFTYLPFLTIYIWPSVFFLTI